MLSLVEFNENLQVYQLYNKEDAYQDFFTKDIVIKTRFEMQKTLYVKISTLQGTPFYMPMYITVYQPTGTPEKINFNPLFDFAPSNVSYTIDPQKNLTDSTTFTI